MPYQVIDQVRIFGDPEPQALAQAKMCARTGRVRGVALMADHHKGYSQPIGGVVVYEPDQVSPSGVGFDIACGNKAARTLLTYPEIAQDVPKLMDRIWREISFGIGRKNPRPVEHPVLEHPLWREEKHLRPLHKLAAEQLGTVGGGNHYVDLFVEPATQRIWVGVHFGSRGPGFRIASGVLNLMHGRPFDHPRAGERMDAPPAILDLKSELGQFYWEAMHLAGAFAYAGRDYVVDQVLRILGTRADLEVHNHHNFAWLEEVDGQKAIVVRKGATPNRPGQLSFVGGSMGDISVILRGVDSEESRASFYSTVHGAGRLLSRTQAAGKWRRQGGRRVRVAGAIDMDAVRRDLARRGIELRGGGPDEAPAVYRRLQTVLEAHSGSIEILHVLHPIGVAMAGPDEFDPYKD